MRMEPLYCSECGCENWAYDSVGSKHLSCRHGGMWQETRPKITRVGVVEPSDSRSPVEILLEARRYAKLVREIAKVHVTINFYLRLQADKNYGAVAPIYDMRRIAQEEWLPLFDLPVQVHLELCEKQFWFEDKGGKEISYTVPL